MPVHCPKCGEELIGAVNRCWKCGEKFALPPERDGRPPVRAAVAAVHAETLNAVVVEATAGSAGNVPTAVPRTVQRRATPTADFLEVRLASQMAMGGTVVSLVLGVIAAFFAALWPPAAIVAVLGLVMGIWGLSSPRRNWALVGMLLCCLAIGLGTYGMAHKVYLSIKEAKMVPEETLNVDTAP